MGVMHLCATLPVYNTNMATVQTSEVAAEITRGIKTVWAILEYFCFMIGSTAEAWSY
jgi:hypothetical protein